jgi:hypothetical protein
MDKYLSAPHHSHTSATGGGGGGGLLALMKKSREAKTKQQTHLVANHQTQLAQSTSVDKWKSLDSMHLSLGDVQYQTKHRKFNTDSSFNRGWRVIDGEKVYVTMRSVVFTTPSVVQSCCRAIMN